MYCVSERRTTHVEANVTSGAKAYCIIRIYLPAGGTATYGQAIVRPDWKVGIADSLG